MKLLTASLLTILMTSTNPALALTFEFNGNETILSKESVAAHLEKPFSEAAQIKTKCYTFTAPKGWVFGGGGHIGEESRCLAVPVKSKDGGASLYVMTFKEEVRREITNAKTSLLDSTQNEKFVERNGTTWRQGIVQTLEDAENKKKYLREDTTEQTWDRFVVDLAYKNDSEREELEKILATLKILPSAPPGK